MTPTQLIGDQLKEIDCELAAEKALLTILRSEIESRRRIAEAIGRLDLLERIGSLLGQIESLLGPFADGPADVRGGAATSVEMQAEPVEQSHEADLDAVELIAETEPNTPTSVGIPEPAESAPHSQLDLPRYKPRKSAQRLNLQPAESAFHREVAQFLNDDSWSLPRLALCKALVCKGRALLEKLRAQEADESNVLRTIEELKHRHNEETNEAEFFGLNLKRDHSPDCWLEVAEAYCRLEVAERALDTLEETWDESIAQATNASESLLRRLAFDRGLGFQDNQQGEVHKRLMAFNNGRVFLGWGIVEGKGVPALEDLKQQAAMLDVLLAKRSKSVKRERSETALAGLIDAIDDEFQPQDAIDRIRQAVLDCLNAGIPPSNKALRERLLPYRGYLDSLMHPQANTLRANLAKYETSLITSHQNYADHDLEVEGLDPMLEAVAKLLKGKKVLLVGGRTDKPKMQAMSERLHLGKDAIEWPGTTADTNPASFEAKVDQADVVCLLIRWSRHSYKEILDRAKDRGKLTVVIKAGIGINRFVHDVYMQLIAPSITASSDAA